MTGFPTQKNNQVFPLQLVSEVGLAGLSLAHRKMWFGKRKDKMVADKNPLISVWSLCHHLYWAATVLLPVTNGKSCHWDSEMFPTLGKWFTGWIRKLKLMKKAKCSIALLLLCAITKLKVKENDTVDFDAWSISDFSIWVSIASPKLASR